MTWATRYPRHQGKLLGMKMWGFLPLLAIVLFAGGSAHATVAYPTVASPTPVPAPSSPQGAPASGPSPVLRQTGLGQWATTVVLTDVLPACSYPSTQAAVTHSFPSVELLSLQGGSRPTKAIWDLVAQTASRTVTIADRTAQVIQLGTGGQALGTSTTASFTTTASACEVVLTFAGLPEVPETASLVFDDAATSFAIPLVVSRDVTLADYLAIPALAGAVLALLLLLLTMLRFRIYGPKGFPLGFGGRDFWGHSVTASGAWSLRDSWATNITSGLVVVGIILAGTTAAGSLFPGVPLDRFAIVSVAAAGIVLIAPAILGILRMEFMNRNPSMAAADLLLPDNESAYITLRSMASIMISSNATVRAAADQGMASSSPPVRVSSGHSIHVAPGAVIQIPGGGRMNISGENITIHSGGFTVDPRVGGALALSASAEARPGWESFGDIPLVTRPTQINTSGTAIITVTDAADMLLPAKTMIGARRRELLLARSKTVQLHANINSITTNLASVLMAAVVTMFGIGAEIGILVVLAFSLSEADLIWRAAMLAGIVLAGILLLWYAVNAIQALADPEPGSALASPSETSFIL
jgi:hypothetical protein